MTLQEAIRNISPEKDLAIYASTPFTPECEARYGTTSLEKDGKIDDKELFANGVYCGQFLNQHTEGLGEKEKVDWEYSQAAVKMITRIERLRVSAQANSGYPLF